MFRGDRLRKLREEKNLMLTELARFLQVPHSTLSVWEGGKAVPALDKIVKIAKFFDVSIEYLLGLTDDPKPIRKVMEEYPWFPSIKPIPIFDGTKVGPLGIDETTPKVGWLCIPRDAQGQYAVTVPNDDMAPLLNKDDVVVVSQGETKDRDLVFAVIDNTPTIRRIRALQNDGKYILEAENPDIMPLIIPGGVYVQILGRVTFVFKKVT